MDIKFKLENDKKYLLEQLDNIKEENSLYYWAKAQLEYIIELEKYMNN